MSAVGGAKKVKKSAPAPPTKAKMKTAPAIFTGKSNTKVPHQKHKSSSAQVKPSSTDYSAKDLLTALDTTLNGVGSGRGGGGSGRLLPVPPLLQLIVSYAVRFVGVVTTVGSELNAAAAAGSDDAGGVQLWMPVFLAHYPPVIEGTGTGSGVQHEKTKTAAAAEEESVLIVDQLNHRMRRMYLSNCTYDSIQQ